MLSEVELNSCRLQGNFSHTPEYWHFFLSWLSVSYSRFLVSPPKQTTWTQVLGLLVKEHKLKHISIKTRNKTNISTITATVPQDTVLIYK